MDTPSSAWSALQRLQAALAAQYTPGFIAAVRALGLQREPVGVLMLAASRDPAPLTSRALLACLPYHAETAFSTRLERLAAGGWLTAVPDGFSLTERGRAAAQSLQDAVHARLKAINPMPPDHLDRLALMLGNLLAICLAAARAGECACLDLSGALHAAPGPEHPPLARLAHGLEALANFRCDQHRAAWRPLGVTGPAWEVLTCLWRGHADSAATLQAWADRQPFPRGLSAADYAACLRALNDRGWVEPVAGEAWRLTPLGQRTRTTAEARTDRLFFAPWASLPAAALSNLHAQTVALTHALG